jgi:hypothetical protein
MTPETRAIANAAAQAVSRLVKECRKGGPLYVHNPRVVAQVSRTAKWLLNAIQRLHRELDTHTDHAAL